MAARTCAGDPATGDPFKGDRAFKGDGQRLLNGDQVASCHSATRSGSGDSGSAGGGCRCCRERRHSRFARARRFTSSCDVATSACGGCVRAAHVHRLWLTCGALCELGVGGCGGDYRCVGGCDMYSCDAVYWL